MSGELHTRVGDTSQAADLDMLQTGDTRQAAELDMLGTEREGEGEGEREEVTKGEYQSERGRK